MSWDAPCKPAVRIVPTERVELHIGPKMEMLEVARILAMMQKDRPDRQFFIDGTHRTITSRPRRD